MSNDIAAAIEAPSARARYSQDVLQAVRRRWHASRRDRPEPALADRVRRFLELRDMLQRVAVGSAAAARLERLMREVSSDTLPPEPPLPQPPLPPPTCPQDVVMPPYQVWSLGEETETSTPAILVAPTQSVMEYKTVARRAIPERGAMSVAAGVGDFALDSPEFGARFPADAAWALGDANVASATLMEVYEVPLAFLQDIPTTMTVTAYAEISQGHENIVRLEPAESGGWANGLIGADGWLTLAAYYDEGRGAAQGQTRFLNAFRTRYGAAETLSRACTVSTAFQLQRGQSPTVWLFVGVDVRALRAGDMTEGAAPDDRPSGFAAVDLATEPLADGTGEGNPGYGYPLWRWTDGRTVRIPWIRLQFCVPQRVTTRR
jgi:hypothetical protein